MPSIGEPASVTSLPSAIERYFDVCLFLLLLTGFGTLAASGGLDWTTVVLVIAALSVRGYLLAKGSTATIPELWTTYLTLAYSLFYLADYFLLSRSFLRSTVHLVLFVMVVRMFSTQRERDRVMLAVLSFLMVLAAAVLTVDTLFLLCFAVFLVIAVVTFALMEMRHSARRATVPAREPGEARAPRRLALSLGLSAPVLAALILLLASAIFFVLPRASSRFLGTFAPNLDFATGFSDRVQLGAIGQLQQSNAVVMHVQIDGDKRGAYDLKWRGVTLSLFDGRVWSNPLEQYRAPRLADGRYALESASSTANRPPTDRPVQLAVVAHYSVVMEPIGSTVFFLAPQPLALEGPYRAVTLDRGGSVFDVDPERPVGRYSASSNIAIPPAAELRAAGSAYPPNVLLTYLQLPPVDLRVSRLAQDITASSTNNYDRATAIDRYLESHYQYTLELPRTVPRDPIANFLFERRRGHCEYFASSMAIMLRTLHIPARVVNGFRGGEFNDLTSTYVIRGRNAHSWVETYFPGYGWVDFDPTPPAAPAAQGAWARAALYLDALSSFWREWVVDYDASHQKSLGQDASRQTRALSQDIHSWAQRTYLSLVHAARTAQTAMLESPARWTATALALGLLLIVAANAGRMWRALQRRNLRAHPERSPGPAAAVWYEQMLRTLARNGWQKAAAETPLEFAAGIQEQHLREQVLRFTRDYESARFGDSAEAARRLPELFAEITAGSAK